VRTEGKAAIPAKTVLQQITDILKTPAILAGVISPGASIPKTLPQVTEEKEGKCNAGGPAEGNDANAQLVKSILQQITGILKTPVVQAGVVSPGASGSPALLQVTEEEEEEGSAGDPIEGDDVIAQTNAAAKALTDAAAAIANAEAAVPQANAAKTKAQTQATQVQEPTKPKAPLEGQLESAEKEVMPAVTVDMAAIMAAMQSMQQDNATRMSALQAATDTEQAVCTAISTCNETIQYMVYVATADTDEQQALTANSDCVHGSLSDLFAAARRSRLQHPLQHPTGGPPASSLATT
jgi:hypothetical protein